MSAGAPSRSASHVSPLDGANRRSLVRLLQLASPALPVGGYSYSQGLEWRIASGGIRSGADAARWLADMLEHVMANGDAPVLLRLFGACSGRDAPAFVAWNAWYRASRESRELRAETEQMGDACLRLARELDILDAFALDVAREAAPLTFPAAFSLAAHAMEIASADALEGYLMSWLENQVLVVMKTLPLGQAAGQRMLYALAARIPGVVAHAATLGDDDVSSFAPGLALASVRHETQYSRLFRS